MKPLLADGDINSQAEAADMVVGLFGLVLLCSLVLTIPGTYLAIKDKVIVYNGQFDLALSFVIPVIALLALVLATVGPEASFITVGIVLLLLLLSIRKNIYSEPKHR
jgi:hypothetical protein